MNTKGQARQGPPGPRGGRRGRGWGSGRSGGGGGRSSGTGGAPPAGPSGSGGFRTDTDISRGAQDVKGRPLERWVDPDADGPDLSLEESTSQGHWDQFKANQEKFGVESTYDELLYTTAIDRSRPDYNEVQRRADQIAAEIEGQAPTNNSHLAEERGQLVDDSGMDEEDKYSGVQRSNNLANFASQAAQAAQQRSGQIQDQERSDRIADYKKFSESHKRSSPASAEGTTNVEGKARKEEKANTTSESQQKPKPKQKFNFAAAAAKTHSFKPTVGAAPSSSGTSPSPGPAAIPRFVPSPFYPASAAHSPIPSVPVSKVGQQPSELDKIKPVSGHFDYFAALAKKNEKPPRGFATAPTWPTTSENSYREQFSVPAAPMPVPMMPYRYMMPQQYV